MLLGTDELGKEAVIELQRFGVEVIAVDRYANAPMTDELVKLEAAGGALAANPPSQRWRSFGSVNRP